MGSRSKALGFFAGLLLILVVGVVAVVVGSRMVARHVPGHALLAIDVAGPLPELPPSSPFAGLFATVPISQQEIREGLVAAAGDPRVAAVRLRISDMTASMAAIEEFRALIEKVNEAGKHTTAYLDTAGEFAPGNLTYFLASSCQRVVVNPMGDVNLVGLQLASPFIRGTLDALEIQPDFPGIGKYKTARNLFLDKEFTPEQKEMSQWLLDSLSGQLVDGIARSRGLSPAEVQGIVERAPLIGAEAVKAKLVDQQADWSSCREDTLDLGGERLEEVSLRRYLRAAGPYSSGTPVAVVLAEGSIVRGESGYSPVPLFGGDMMGSETMARAWRQVRASGAKAVIFRIDSPGGSAIASELIREEMVKTAKEIPVVVSMGGVAASGGYWITCGAQRLVADPASITASIGVFSGHFATEGFWRDKLGVTWSSVKSAPNADIFGSLQPWTPEQRVLVEKFLDRIYGSFVQRVARARRMSPEAVDAVGRGRVFTGQQALERGLVDELGGFETALAAARKLAGLAPEAPVELRFYPEVKPFWEKVLSGGDDTRVDLATVLSSLQPGAVQPFGPVWLPPAVVR